MQLKEHSSNQKLRGAYYTPSTLSKEIVSLLDLSSANTILEPSCGDGVFIDALLTEKERLPDSAVITAVEIDGNEAKKVSDKNALLPIVNVVNDDFLKFYKREYKNSKYDLIIGNPPYIRYQYLTVTQREIQSKILTDHGMKANKLINAWVCFLVACVQMLSDHGKIAFIIPAEIMQVAYAEELRLFLSNTLSKITLVTFKELVFPEIEQEIVVLIGEKGDQEKGIRIVELTSVDDFKNLDLEKNGYQKIQHVKEKWVKYFVDSEESDIIRKIRNDHRFAKFSDFGTINVGITTGNNGYFSIDRKTELEYGLADITLPLIGRSSHAHGVYFTEADWRSNVDAGKRAKLIRFPNTPFEDYPDGYKSYIQAGEDAGENSGYKCSIRDRWYIVPSVWVPDAFFLRRNNLYPKFVLNECGAVSTDTMHRMKFNDGIDPEDVMLSYYNSVSFAFTEICGRSYGGGVLEILPGEMGNIVLPIITGLDDAKKKALIEVIDIAVRCDDDIEKALDIVDKELLVEHLGIDANVCNICRGIWKKLQMRRLGRQAS